MSDDREVSDWATDFDLSEEHYRADPGPVWKDLHERCPIAHTERNGGLWMATRYGDARELAVMTAELSNRQVSIAQQRPDIDLLADYHSHITPPISNDPPEHAPLRRLILPFFTPTAVEEHRAYTEALCNELIDGFIDTGRADAAVDYAQQISPRVIGHMLGIDTSRSEEFTGWVRGMIELGFDDPEVRNHSRKTIMAFFAELIDERRANPGDDYISQLTQKEVDGKPLTDKQVVNFCVLLLIAGIDTTWSSLGSSLWHLATHEADRQRLANESDLFPTAIEELLRFYAPVSVGRIAMEDVTFNDVTLKRGERLMINYPAACRDAEAFERADEVLLDRKKNRHFAFGVGIHRCAGSNLARMEMDVGLRTWMRRIPEFQLDTSRQVTWAGGQVRGARNVPVIFG